MHMLLKLLPSAKLVDMFVSDEIEFIFEKVREEYVVRHDPQAVEGSEANLEANHMRESPSQTAAGHPANQNAPSNPEKADAAQSNAAQFDPSRPAIAEKKSSTGYWIAGSVVAAAGVGTA